MSVPVSERKEKTPTEDYLLASEMGASLKLLPCPFCGSDEIYYKKYQTPVGLRYGVLCGGCIAEVDCGYAAQMGQARDRWNKRTPAPAVEIKEVCIPACSAHEGYKSVKIKLRWICPICGKPRGAIRRARSYDGSLILFCDGWENPCGHIDCYPDCRAEAVKNGLNPELLERNNEN